MPRPGVFGPIAGGRLSESPLREMEKRLKSGLMYGVYGVTRRLRSPFFIFP